jgi:sulfate/thiosulfate-binding protein
MSPHNLPTNSLGGFYVSIRRTSLNRGIALSLITGLTLLAAGCNSSSTASNTGGGAASGKASKEPITINNVSYDPTRELYVEFNKAFATYWLEKSGQEVEIVQSHAGAAKQARAVIDGQPADVLTLAIGYDIDQIVKLTDPSLLPENWQSRLPHNSCPYTSTIVFLVRKGNPKGIKDWDDLAKPGVNVVTPNPKTSGGARYNYLAAWGFARRKNNGDDAKAREFVTSIYKNAPVLGAGARDSTTTFVQNGEGDVLITWENEAFLAIEQLGKDKYEMVVPSISVLAEPPVTVVDRNAEAHGAVEVSTAYLEYLYSPIGQQLAAKHFYRPNNPEHARAEDIEKFPKIEMFKIDEEFGGWAKAQAEHFDDEGVFDQIREKLANEG